MTERLAFDLAGHVERSRRGPCFICEYASGNPDYAHHTIAADDEAVIFLSKYPTLPGYTLVCPRAHRQDLAEDLSHAEYLALQARVYRVARALKRVFDAERIYVMSLGSLQGNSHLHWHVVPLPKGIAYEHQQFYAVMAENGVLALTPQEMADMAQRIGDVYRTLDA